MNNANEMHENIMRFTNMHVYNYNLFTTDFVESDNQGVHIQVRISKDVL